LLRLKHLTLPWSHNQKFVKGQSQEICTVMLLHHVFLRYLTFVFVWNFKTYFQISIEYPFKTFFNESVPCLLRSGAGCWSFSNYKISCIQYFAKILHLLAK
jgi:hypothetical protein